MTMPTATEMKEFLSARYWENRATTTQMKDAISDHFGVSDQERQRVEISQTGKPNGLKIFDHRLHTALALLKKEMTARRLRHGMWEFGDFSVNAALNGVEKEAANGASTKQPRRIAAALPPNPGHLRQRAGAMIQEIYDALRFHQAKADEYRAVLREFGLPEEPTKR